MSVNKFKLIGEERQEILSPPSSLSSPRILNKKKEEKKEEKSTSFSTVLLNGETVSKSNSIITAIGSIEEVLSYIGIIKAEYLGNQENKFDIDISAKLFLFARLTQIQETLIDIIRIIGTSGKKQVLPQEKIRELEQEIKNISHDDNIHDYKKKICIIPGSSVLESTLMYCRSLVRKAERQVCKAKYVKMNMFPDENVVLYINKLGDYFLALSLHVLFIQSKVPLKRPMR